MNKKRFIIETMTGKAVEEWEENNRKLKEQKELRDFINKLQGKDWQGLANCYYHLALENGKTHKEAMSTMRKELIKFTELIQKNC